MFPTAFCFAHSLGTLQCRKIPGSLYEERQLEKQRLYGDVERRLEFFFQSHHADESSWPQSIQAMIAALPSRDTAKEELELQERRRAMQGRIAARQAAK